MAAAVLGRAGAGALARAGARGLRGGRPARMGHPDDPHYVHAKNMCGSAAAPLLSPLPYARPPPDPAQEPSASPPPAAPPALPPRCDPRRRGAGAGAREGAGRGLGPASRALQQPRPLRQPHRSRAPPYPRPPSPPTPRCPSFPCPARVRRSNSSRRLAGRLRAPRAALPGLPAAFRGLTGRRLFLFAAKGTRSGTCRGASSSSGVPPWLLWGQGSGSPSLRWSSRSGRQRPAENRPPAFTIVFFFF